MPTFWSLIAAFLLTGNPGSRALADYLERAALTWLALPDCGAAPERCAGFERQELESPAAVADRVREVARDVASLLEDGFSGHDEPSPYAHDPRKARAGLLLMSLAFHESRFRGYVADGRCPNPEWRRSEEGRHLLPLGPCDGGLASTLWQIHVGRGLWVGWDAREWGSERSSPRDVLLSLTPSANLSWPLYHQNAAMLALHMARASIRATGTLRYYTGEWEGRAPKAGARERLALDYYCASPLAGTYDEGAFGECGVGGVVYK
jgi:hypothetical protein